MLGFGGIINHSSALNGGAYGSTQHEGSLIISFGKVVNWPMAEGMLTLGGVTSHGRDAVMDSIQDDAIMEMDPPFFDDLIVATARCQQTPAAAREEIGTDM